MIKNKKVIVLIFILLVIFLVSLKVYIDNENIITTKIDVISNKIPDKFDDFKIGHISDFHNASYKDINTKIKDILLTNEVDVIFLTGDLIDSRNTDIDVALDFVNEIKDISRIYYVTGNHEARISNYKELEDGLKELGVVILRNESDVIRIDNQHIKIIGIDDPAFLLELYFENDEINRVKNTINEILKQDYEYQDESYKILLSHRPELFSTYQECNIDLTFSGHAHGGQFVIPFIGGLIAPNQGFFPKYTSGIYNLENSSMVVSRGIGNSIIPIRINNRPEVIITTLKIDN